MGCRPSSPIISSIGGLNLANKTYSLQELGRGGKNLLLRVAVWCKEKKKKKEGKNKNPRGLPAWAGPKSTVKSQQLKDEKESKQQVGITATQCSTRTEVCFMGVGGKSIRAGLQWKGGSTNIKWKILPKPPPRWSGIVGPRRSLGGQAAALGRALNAGHSRSSPHRGAANAAGLRLL